MPTNKSQAIAELAHDLQTGLGRTSIPDFDRLPIVGMASILALHIKGLGAIEYGVLRQVSDHFFDIPAVALPQVLDVLEEIEYLTLIKSGKSIKTIIPSVPHFDSVYVKIDEYLSNETLTEHEQLAIAILGELTNKPEKRDTLFGRLGAEKKLFKRCENIVSESGLVLSKRARGQDILVSPIYFADNLDALVDMAAAGGATRVERVLKLIGQSQGWPLSVIEKRGEVDGTKISSEELNILKSLVADGVLKPPSINRPNSTSELFVFTPRPGNKRLNAGNREVYERAMGLVAAVRKGQLLPEPEQYRIRSPTAILSALRDKKYIGTNSEASHQYRNLVSLRVGKLVNTSGDRFQLQLIDTPENLRAIDEALSLVRTGQMSQSSVDDGARIALSQDETYVQSVVSSSKFRASEKLALKPDEQQEVDQLLLDLK
jgi:hypothetical protein